MEDSNLLDCRDIPGQAFPRLPLLRVPAIKPHQADKFRVEDVSPTDDSRRVFPRNARSADAYVRCLRPEATKFPGYTTVDNTAHGARLPPLGKPTK